MPNISGGEACAAGNDNTGHLSIVHVDLFAAACPTRSECCSLSRGWLVEIQNPSIEIFE